MLGHACCLMSIVLLLPACVLSSAGTGGAGGMAGAGGGGAAGGAVGNGGSGGAGEGGSPAPGAGRRVKITFQNAGGELLQGFPVLVRLDPGRIEYARTSGGGSDLRFVDADATTVLPHEIEDWAENGESLVWVRVPAIEATGEDYIWMHYGDPAAGAAQDAEAVWSGFVGVYHLAGGPAEVGRDSSPGGHHGTPNGSMDTDDPGQIGRALRVNGIGRIDLSGTQDFSAGVGEARTFEAWFRTTNGNTQHLFSQEVNCRGYGIELGVSDTPLLARLFTGGGCGDINEHYADTDQDYNDDDWHHVAAVIDRPGSLLKLHVDGALVDSGSIDDMDGATSSVAWIGSAYSGNSAFYGSIDEVRISGSGRSDRWISAQYRSMRDTFAVYGAPESP